MIDSIILMKFLHLLGLVYWLGGDLGTFYASRFVTNPDLSVNARKTAFTIMMGCDQAPRICMPLIFPLGFEIAMQLGYIELSPAWSGFVWLTSFAMLGTVLTIHFAHGKSFIPMITKLDFYLRIAVVIGTAAVAVYTLSTGEIISDSWISYKILIFSALVACGLIIRIKLKPFGTAWGALVTSGPSDEVNKVIEESLSGARPYVVLIWIGLLVASAYGLHLFN